MPLLGKTKKEVLSEFRCGEILDAAKRVFADKGFSVATVDDVAEAAGIAKGTIYLYFPSKREMFIAALRQGILAVNAETQRRIEAAEDTADKVRAFIETRMEFSDRDREFYRLYYAEFGNLGRVCQEFQDLYDQQADRLEKVLARGVRRGDVRRMNTAAAARIVYDITRGAIAQRILGWSQGPAHEDADFVFDIVWRGIGCA